MYKEHINSKTKKRKRRMELLVEENYKGKLYFSTLKFHLDHTYHPLNYGKARLSDQPPKIITVSPLLSILLLIPMETINTCTTYDFLKMRKFP